MTEKNWLEEQLKTSRNLIDISLLLVKLQRSDLLPTALETLLEQVQTIVDENCVIK